MCPSFLTSFLTTLIVGAIAAFVYLLGGSLQQPSRLPLAKPLQDLTLRLACVVENSHSRDDPLYRLLVQLQGVLAALDHYDGLPFYQRIGRGRAQLALRDQCMVIFGSIELYLMSLQPDQPARPQVPLPFADTQYPFHMHMGIRSPDGLQSPLPTTIPLPTVVGNFWNLNNIANTIGSSFNSSSTQMHPTSIVKKSRRRQRVYKSESDEAVNGV